MSSSDTKVKSQKGRQMGRNYIEQRDSEHALVKYFDPIGKEIESIC